MPSSDVTVGSVRPRTSRGLVGLAVVLAVLALCLSYVGRAFLEPVPFADRAVASLRDSAVQADVADRLTNVIVTSGAGDLISVRPLVRVSFGLEGRDTRSDRLVPVTAAAHRLGLTPHQAKGLIERAVRAMQARADELGMNKADVLGAA